MSKPSHLEVKQNKGIEKYDPKTNAYEVHSYEAAERVANRIKDADALEKALLGKLEAQREFAAHYRSLFSQGKTSDNSVRSAEEYCKKFGFSDRTVRRWVQRLSDPAKFEAETSKIVKKCREIAEMWQAANYSSESVEWYTPEPYIEAVRGVLGEIDLDPASSTKANKTVKAAQFFTKKDSPFEQDWHGRFFLNPPYGKHEGESLAAKFCQKAISEYDLGHAEAGIILVNSVHSQNWQACLYDFPVCFVDHRIKFESGDGETNDNPTFQNIFIYLGQHKERFAAVFKEIGYVMEQISVD